MVLVPVPCPPVGGGFALGGTSHGGGLIHHVHHAFRHHLPGVGHAHHWVHQPIHHVALPIPPVPLGAVPPTPPPVCYAQVGGPGFGGPFLPPLGGGGPGFIGPGGGGFIGPGGVGGFGGGGFGGGAILAGLGAAGLGGLASGPSSTGQTPVRQITTVGGTGFPAFPILDTIPSGGGPTGGGDQGPLGPTQPMMPIIPTGPGGGTDQPGTPISVPEPSSIAVLLLAVAVVLLLRSRRILR